MVTLTSIYDTTPLHSYLESVVGKILGNTRTETLIGATNINTGYLD